MIQSARIDVWLARLWWLLCPSFAVLTATLIAEGACAQPYRLLPKAMSQPALAWLLALLYLGAHVWVVVVYIRTIERADSLVPHVSAIRAVWGNTTTKIWVMLSILAIEYLPMTVWRLLGRAFCAQ